MLSASSKIYKAACDPVDTFCRGLNFYVYGNDQTPCNTVAQIASVIAILASVAFTLQSSSSPKVLRYAFCVFAFGSFLAATALRRLAEHQIQLVNQVKEHRDKLSASESKLSKSLDKLEKQSKKKKKTFEEHLTDLDQLLKGLEKKDLEAEQVEKVCGLIKEMLGKIPEEKQNQFKEQAGEWESKINEIQVLIQRLIDERKETVATSDDILKREEACRRYAKSAIDIVKKLYNVSPKEIRDEVIDELLENSKTILNSMDANLQENGDVG